MIPLLVLSTTASADEGTFDHGYAQLAKFLDGAVTSAGSVDYDLLATRRPALDGWLDQVKVADLAGWSNAQKLALYVNAYNGYTIELILDEGQPASIRDLDGGKVWDTRKFVVAGESLTLNQIENDRARPLADGRVHAALNCASKGCPPLPTAPLVASTLEPQLDAAAKRWVATNAFRLEGSTIALSSIFDWYSADFAPDNKGDIAGVEGKEESALWFLARFADAATKQKLTSGGLKPTWQSYDWSLNEK